MLTPDSSQLLVADFGAQSVYLVDPDTAAGTSVNVGGVSGDANSGPVRVAATSTKNVFVGLAGFSGGASAFVSMNTLKIITPALPAGAQPVTITNPDGQSVSLTAAFTAN